MTDYLYTFTDVKPTECEVFSDATEAELRVLVALMDTGGRATDDELIRRSGVSKARVASGIALWEEAGVIKEQSAEVGEYGNVITEEFESREDLEELPEQSGAEIAIAIRNNKLSSLFDECAALMGKAMLSPMEIKKLTELISQYSLDEEYVLTLAAHMKEKGSFTPYLLITRAKKLCAEGISTADELSVYLAGREREGGEIMEYRRIFGMFDRAPSNKEREYFLKWGHEYCYGTEVVSLAYDFASINSGKLSFTYIDKLLADWHNAGCKTVEECLKRYEEVKRLRTEEEATKREAVQAKPKRARGEQKQKPRYGDFDPEAALKMALSRSFFDENSDGDK